MELKKEQVKSKLEAGQIKYNRVNDGQTEEINIKEKQKSIKDVAFGKTCISSSSSIGTSSGASSSSLPRRSVPFQKSRPRPAPPLSLQAPPPTPFHTRPRAPNYTKASSRVGEEGLRGWGWGGGWWAGIRFRPRLGPRVRPLIPLKVVRALRDRRRARVKDTMDTHTHSDDHGSTHTHTHTQASK